MSVPAAATQKTLQAPGSLRKSGLRVLRHVRIHHPADEFTALFKGPHNHAACAVRGISQAPIYRVLMMTPCRNARRLAARSWGTSGRQDPWENGRPAGPMRRRRYSCRPSLYRGSI